MNTRLQNEQPALYVTSFGEFSIALLDSSGSIAEQLTSGRKHSNKQWLLIEYLIFAGKSVPFDELIEHLWSDEDGVDNPIAALRLMVHRARAELNKLGKGMGSSLLLHVGKTYCWNQNIETRIDAVVFEQLYEQAKQAEGAERIELLLNAAKLYTGHFLPDSSTNRWVQLMDAFYHSKYLAICEEAAKLLSEAGQTLEVVGLCKQAIMIDPYAENLHIAFLEALISTGNLAMAKTHYKYISDMYMKSLGITLPAKFEAVFKLLNKSTNAMESSLTVIRGIMNENDADNRGAYFVEYEVFKQIYQIKQRECDRTGQALQLGLISATPRGGKNAEKAADNASFMEKLGITIRESMRQIDVYTQYSALQYIVLLQSASYKNGQMVLERIERNIIEQNRRSGYMLQCSLLPMLPKEA